MKQEIINGGNARYLGELERFKDGIPFGIVNKTKTDVGEIGRASCRKECRSRWSPYH